MTDPEPLRGVRRARLRAAMAREGLDALVLTAAGSVRYASGAVPLHGEASVEAARPFAAVVTAERVHVLGVESEAVPPDTEALALPRPAGAAASTLAALLGAARRVGVERLSLALGAALGRALPQAQLVAAEPAVLAARAVKSDEEVALLAAAQRLNEEAVAEVLPAIVPGVPEVELTGRFLAAMARRGVVACHVEPLWCVLPRRAADAPWTFPGGLPYRELPDRRRLGRGDRVMIDTGMLHRGYMSDFGCTWPCAGEPDAAHRRLRARWEEIVEAVLAVCRDGVTVAALHRAARAVAPAAAPWPRPLYLAHGIGIGGVEPPFIGTDLGLEAEEGMRLEAGMVLVLEPFAWEEGVGGYRAERTVVITSSGWRSLSAPPP